MKKRSFFVMFAALMLLGLKLRSQQAVLATIKPGPTSNSVNIYFTPNFTDNSHFIDNLVLTLSIPVSTPVPTYTVAPTALLSSIDFTSGTGFTSAPITYNGRIYFNFGGSFQNQNPATFTSGVEVLAATVTFNGSPGLSTVQLNDLTFNPMFGGPNGLMFYYVQENFYGPVGCTSCLPGDPPPTLPGVPVFYGSPGISTTGTDANGDQFVETILPISLPIHLLSFQATKTIDSRVKLNWSTSQEQNMDFFEVERSSDGSNFHESPAHVPAAGNNRNKMDYATYDPLPRTGHNYYRLKMVEHDGTTTYSAVRNIDFKDLSTNAVIVMPNPANKSSVIQVKAGEDQQINYTLADALGQVIRNGKVNVIKGINKIPLGLDGMPAGIYLLSVNGRTIIEKVKITKSE
jgi:hypothetical protein